MENLFRFTERRKINAEVEPDSNKVRTRTGARSLPLSPHCPGPRSVPGGPGRETPWCEVSGRTDGSREQH